MYFHNPESIIFFIQLVYVLVKVFPPKINYEIHDKELLTIVDAFKELHHLLEGVKHKMIVYFNHKNFQYFMMAHVLN
jgi:hypothetical protein